MSGKSVNTIVIGMVVVNFDAANNLRDENHFIWILSLLVQPQKCVLNHADLPCFLLVSVCYFIC